MSGKVILAESAGFCYGVQRAVNLAQKTADECGPCWMLGDLIHNTHVVEDLARRGIRKMTDSDSLGTGDTVIIRSHGELKSVMDALESRGVHCVNATCPNVVRIQKLVAQAEQEGRQHRHVRNGEQRVIQQPFHQFLRDCRPLFRAIREASHTA